MSICVICGELIHNPTEMNQLITGCLNEMPYICVHKEKESKKNEETRNF